MTSKEKVFWLLSLLVGALLLFLSTEILLRIAGYEPVAPYFPNEKVVHEPDPILGWKKIPGTYVLPPYHPSGTEIHMRFLPNGTRATSENGNPGKPALLTIGGSFTGGWAVSDHETYAWKLQEKFSEVEVLNYGTNAYGTYQSLLMLEQVLPKIDAPAIVLYGFFDHHLDRNVASYDWLKGLSQRAPSWGRVLIPFATVDNNNQLVRNNPDTYAQLPLRHWFATPAFLEFVYTRARTSSRAKKRTLVTKKILREMNAFTKDAGAEFAVVILTSTDWFGRTKRSMKINEQYKEFLKRQNIRVIDCAINITPEMRVVGEGHPKPEVHTHWANCIAEALSDKISSLTPPNLKTEAPLPQQETPR